MFRIFSPDRRFVAAALVAALGACSSGDTVTEHCTTTGGSSGPSPAAPSLPAPLAVPGTTYYVNATTGSDDFDGRSPATAVRSLRKAAAALSATGGDRLVVEGTFAETLQLKGINNPAAASPDPAQPTVIQCAFDAAGMPAVARIDGGITGAASFPYDKRGLPPGFGAGTGNYLDRGIVITDCNYVTVSGVDVRGIAGHGVLTWKSSHVRLEHLTVEWTAESGILLHNGGTTEPMIADMTVAQCRVNQTNLGAWADLATLQGYNMRPESVSVVSCDGFEIAANHLSNSLMEGIDFKMGSRNGEVRNNVVENTRSAGIYCNEGRDSGIFHNLVRSIGYYDAEDGAGLRLAAPYISSKIPQVITASGASGIVIGNGDLSGINETGRASGIRVWENAISWTLKSAIAVNNQWRLEGRTGWLLDDIHVHNNVAYRSNQGTSSGFSAIVIDVGATNSTVVNNIASCGARRGIAVWEIGLGGFFATSGISHNLHFGNAQQVIQGINARGGNPLFVGAPGAPGDLADFRLAPESPAIGAGMDVALPGARGNSPDIGAYQSSVPPWTAGIGSVR